VASTSLYSSHRDESFGRTVARFVPRMRADGAGAPPAGS
jgi:hypothetical protein